LNDTTKQIARQSVQVLFELAENTRKTNPKFAQRYLEIAQKIAMSARLCLPAAYTRQICKECNTLLIPGESSRIRIKPRREPHVVITCLKCGYQTRIPLKTKKMNYKQEKTESEQNNNQDETSCST
jgi:ribonuclease P protein subunit RPR2